MKPGDRVALLYTGSKFPSEWIGSRATIVEPPADERWLADSAAETGTPVYWLIIDLECPQKPRHFWASEFRPLSLPELVGELAAGAGSQNPEG